MAFYNQNYASEDLDSGYTANTNTSIVHQVFCLSAGDITIKPIGGGKFTWSATAGQSMDVLVGWCSVASGSFIGFKSQHNQVQQPPYFK